MRALTNWWHEELKKKKNPSSMVFSLKNTEMSVVFFVNENPDTMPQISKRNRNGLLIISSF